RAEAFVAATGASVAHGGGRAFYRPSTDSIQLPPREAFIGTPTDTPAEWYYSTLCHELTHYADICRVERSSRWKSRWSDAAMQHNRGKSMKASRGLRDDIACCRIRSGHCLRIVPAETLAQSTCMDASNPITAAVFSAFLKCPTKARLLAAGEPARGAFFTDIEARISSLYKAVAKRRLRTGVEVAEPLDFGQLRRSLDYEAITRHVDCETAVYDFVLPPHRLESRHPQKSPPSNAFVPVLFLPWD